MYSSYEQYQEPQRPFSIRDFIKSITGVEALVVGVVLISVIGVLIWGLLSQDAQNKDLQKETDFTRTLIPALGDFYTNSGAEESARFYPIARCSGDLNEVDYEFIMRQALTGQVQELDTHTYISDFPVDRQGAYSKTFNDREVSYRCPEKLNFSTTQTGGQIYDDGFESCNFSSTQNINNCYLYTSSSNGDEYKLGYYSNVQNCFVVFSQFRNQNVSKVLSC